MKKLILFATATLLLTSCNQEELDRTHHQKDSLMMVLKERETDIQQRETSMNEFMTSFNEVERNLDSIAAKQHLISMNADRSRGEFRASQKDRINSQIKAINNLMDENRQTIADLKRKLKGSNKMNAKLQETIKTLSDQIAQKDIELAALNERLTTLNAQVAQLQTSVDTLSALNNSKSQTITENTTALHTAYYLIGKSKQLRDSKIINRKGGLLGIGKTSRLNENFDNSAFTRIDYTQVGSIAVNSNHVKIITSHPSDTYKLETSSKDKNVITNLVITNPEKFWSISKYLVIEGSPVKTDNSVSTKPKEKENNY